MKTVMTPVKSSNITAIGYNKKELQLLVEFKGGKTFGYKYVSQDELNALLGAESVGKHFNEFIKKTKVPELIVIEAKTEEPAEKDELSIMRDHMLMIERIALTSPIDREILAVAQEALSRTYKDDKNV